MMNRNIFRRLAALESKGQGVGVLLQDGETWRAILNGKTRDFPTMDAARAYLAPRVGVLIVDDIK